MKITRSLEDMSAEGRARVLARFVPGDRSSCWEWLGTRTKTGYGVIIDHGLQFRAHRVVYELLRHPIPKGLVLDHLCRNKLCVNPDHLEPVTNAENVMRGVSPHAVNGRKTHCKRGHELTPENTWVDKRGRRTCKTCRRASDLALKMKRYWEERGGEQNRVRPPRSPRPIRATTVGGNK